MEAWLRGFLVNVHGKRTRFLSSSFPDHEERFVVRAATGDGLPAVEYRVAVRSQATNATSGPRTVSLNMDCQALRNRAFQMITGIFYRLFSTKTFTAR
jgi:hypothetical protein